MDFVQVNGVPVNANEKLAGALPGKVRGGPGDRVPRDSSRVGTGYSGRVGANVGYPPILDANSSFQWV